MLLSVKLSQNCSATPYKNRAIITLVLNRTSLVGTYIKLVLTSMRSSVIRNSGSLSSINSCDHLHLV